MFQPVVLASFGVALPLSDLPSLMVLDRVEPFEVGDVVNDSIYLRVCNDDTCFAPAGHTVVQAMLASSYEWWATRGARYTTEKDAVGEVALAQLGKQIPGLVPSTVRMVDIATPLTFWTSARSWRGAYEGWLPSSESFFGQVRKTLPGAAPLRHGRPVGRAGRRRPHGTAQRTAGRAAAVHRAGRAVPPPAYRGHDLTGVCGGAPARRALRAGSWT